MNAQSHVFAFLVLASFAARAQPSPGHSNPKNQDAIVDKYLRNGAYKFHMYSDDWQRQIDLGLREDSTIAYLWQQKAMPLYKQKRYQEGLPFLNQAVRYNRTAYLPYRGFMKCIFSKDYAGAIEDFSACLKEFGNGYVMDHSYQFYSALSHLQLKEYDKAKRLLLNDTEHVQQTRGDTWVHHLDLLYLGIAQLELKEFQASIQTFERTLSLYPQFSEAHYYKALAEKAIANSSYATSLERAKQFFKQGYTINEDNAIYERYPYQLSAASFDTL